MNSDSLNALSINSFPADLKLSTQFTRKKVFRNIPNIIPQSISDTNESGTHRIMLQNSSEFTPDEPSLFLQELVHQFSLMNAVALATLRNDIAGAPSPLTGYTPGSPLPEMDPAKIPIKEKKGFSNGAFSDYFLYIFGINQTPLARTRYNANRPLGVYGGVSDAEIQQLQAARGPYAKVTLCSMWLQEFVVREHLAGSLGNVGPPIISRLFQFMSDGMVGYNQARKIMWIPFPFPHAQIAALFVWVSIVCIPLMLLQYANYLWLGALMTFFTVLSFSGMHEVAKELENPFRNNPNDLPLCTMQAQFNEAMMVMFVGYHPDSWWASTSLEYKNNDGDEREEITKRDANGICMNVEQMQPGSRSEDNV